MITLTPAYLSSEFIKSVRRIGAKVELYEGSTLVDTFNHDDSLINFTVERVGEEGKFFGFGICQHAKVKILDVNREVDYITSNYSFKISYNIDGYFIAPYPMFYITQCRRDETTNELTIYGYDLIYGASKHTIEEVGLQTPYSIHSAAESIASFLTASGLTLVGTPDDSAFNLSYENGANFEGTELLRDVLDDIAEATQTFYYLDYNNSLTFRQLRNRADASFFRITKNTYFELNTNTNKRLGKIVYATELGDNYHASTSTSGSTQYVRDNAFLTLREDVAELVDKAVYNIGGMTIQQFDCVWRGDISLEPGDRLYIISKDGEEFVAYLLDDVIEYNGALQETTRWKYNTENEDEVESNPASLGAALKKTYAKVDKANQQIEIVAGETAAIKLNNEVIRATVTQIDSNMNDVLLEVSTKMTAEDVSISIQKAMEQGVEAVTTTTGFTFNEEGLHVSKTGSEITTTITEDGMTVYRNNDEVLVADNLGVRAEDLHATTFLIIGNNSRFEDYDYNRTGCFYIGKI